jgi:hypothetical protein
MSKVDTNGNDRRKFLKQAAATAAAALPLSRSVSWASQDQKPLSKPPQSKQATANRSPLTPNAFSTLPLGAVLPTGWLRHQLGIQARGLSGHLDDIWPDVGPNSGWLGGTGESWERGPYFLDGLLPLAFLLDDAILKAKAQKFVEWTLSSQRPDGMFGPSTNDDWWPRMVMLKALTQYEEATSDPRVLPFLTRYFAFQLEHLPNRPLRDWGKFRWQDNALVALWLYNRTGDPKLLELTTLLHQQGFDWQKQYADFKYTQRVTRESIKVDEANGLGDVALSTHGVNNGQALKAAPVWSMVTGQEVDRKGLQQMLHALDTYHGLPNGMFSCDEHLAGRNPSQGSELCTVVETMYSLEQSFAILGDPALGDRLERIAFNALPGTFTDDMWAHQYNQEPNQVEVSLHTKPWTTDGPESNLFGLEPNFGCCTANFSQGWPKFAASLWMATNDGGLVAAAYSPCEITTSISGMPVRLTEETNYPFEDTIRIVVNTAAPVLFPLQLRIPAWADAAKLFVNGAQQPPIKPGSFARLNRTWNNGDVVLLKLPLEPRVEIGFNQSISIVRGPIVFSLLIGEDWVKLRDRGMTADWQIYPTTAWNYALQVDDDGKLPSAIVHQTPITAAPFARASTPATMQVQARKLVSWRAIDGVADAVPPSPVATSQPVETVTLVPYAAAKLRITSFPLIKPIAT